MSRRTQRKRERVGIPFYFLLHLAPDRLSLIPPNPRAVSPAPVHLWLPCKSVPTLLGTLGPLSPGFLSGSELS